MEAILGRRETFRTTETYTTNGLRCGLRVDYHDHHREWWSGGPAERYTARWLSVAARSRPVLGEVLRLFAEMVAPLP